MQRRACSLGQAQGGGPALGGRGRGGSRRRIMRWRVKKPLIIGRMRGVSGVLGREADDL
jgi:hypothetical protein